MNNAVSVNATGLPDFAAALAKITTARAVIDPLGTLIETHEKAWVHFEEISDFSDFISEDDPSYPLVEAEWTIRSTAETGALLAVCAYPAKTLGEARRKARFLIKTTRGSKLSEDNIKALLQSFIDAPVEAEGATDGE